ncbi:hypothetical protein DV736_g4410, partial [Chaetothyriales sp. CBS 134916]
MPQLTDLALVRIRVAKGDFEYKHFRSLSQLVIRRGADVDIWGAVITLIRTISYSGREQTLQRIEGRIFEEICFCTHRAVEGFHAKYFESKNWSRRAAKMWDTAKNRHDGKRWKGLPGAPTQDEVYDWWFGLQRDFLKGTRGVYFKSSFKDVLGDEAKRQLDLFVKSRSHARDSQLNWNEVAVIGELKKSKQDLRGTLLQIGRYVRDIFTHQPTRRFVHAFMLCGTELETWVFDRSGPYSAPVFDIHAEPKKFIQVFCGYVMMSSEELGLDTFIERKGGKLFVTLPVDDVYSKKIKLELGTEPLAYQQAIVCRGTSCYPAKVMRTDNFDSVVKFSWTSDKRPPEADLLQKANKCGVQGLARLVAHSQITTIADLRSGLEFSEPHRFRVAALSACSSIPQSQPASQSFRQLQMPSLVSNSSRKRKSFGTESNPKRSRFSSQLAERNLAEDNVTYPVQDARGTSLVQQTTDPFDNRILRVLAIAPAGRALGQFTSIAELLKGLHDAIRVHQSLYAKGGIIHRDISVNNIILTHFGGMLIDLDLAMEINQGPSRARHRTGTMEFMAIEVLEVFSHTYRHDLESFFYVLIWLCARRGWCFSGNPKGQPMDSILTHWYTGTYKEIATTKRGSMGKGGLEQILEEFPPVFEEVKPLCRKMRGILFPIHDGDFFTGTPQDPKILYNSIIDAFDKALIAISHP